MHTVRASGRLHAGAHHPRRRQDNMRMPLIGNAPTMGRSESRPGACAPGRIYSMKPLRFGLALSALACSLPLKISMTTCEKRPVYLGLSRFSTYVFQRGRFRRETRMLFGRFLAFKCCLETVFKRALDRNGIRTDAAGREWLTIHRPYPPWRFVAPDLADTFPCGRICFLAHAFGLSVPQRPAFGEALF